MEAEKMNNNIKFYIKFSSLIATIIIVLVVIIFGYSNREERYEREIERNREKAFGVKEVTIFDSDIEKDINVVTISDGDELILNSLSEGKADRYRQILLRDDFIDMTLILYSEAGDEIRRIEAFNASLVYDGIGSTYNLYEKNSTTIFKRTLFDVGNGQLVVIEK